MLPIATIKPDKIIKALNKCSMILEYHEGIESVFHIIFNEEDMSYDVGEIFEGDFFPQYSVPQDSMFRITKKCGTMYEVFDSQGESHDIKFLAPVVI